jgi:serine/threonine protein kinase
MSAERITYEHFEIARRPDGSLFELGRGAMGVTYKALDMRLGSFVALKVINANYLNNQVARERFLREARAAAHLNHPNVVAIFHRSQDDSAFFYAMQFIEGETLDDFVKRKGPLPVPLALRLILQAAQGLAAAHERGLIHRDIKPANLMLVNADSEDPDDLLLKVIDFGLAKSLLKDEGGGSGESLTGGFPVGTPYFMSPEQIDPTSGVEIDARTDIYSLGVTLWYLLAGKPPFMGSQFQVFNQHVSKPPPLNHLPPSAASIGPLLTRMMAKEPAGRPANYRELIAALKRLLRASNAGNSAAAPTPTQESAPAPAPAMDFPSASPGETMPLEERTPTPSSEGENYFALTEILRRRGVLPVGEAITILQALAPLVDDITQRGGGRTLDLDPARVFVHFRNAGASETELSFRPISQWPNWEIRFWNPGAQDAPVGDDVTMVSSRPAIESSAVVRLGALFYELLRGAPPPLEEDGSITYVPLPSLNESGNATLRRALTDPARPFPSAAAFAVALIRANTASAPIGPSQSTGVRPVTTPTPPPPTPEPPAPRKKLIAQAPRFTPPLLTPAPPPTPVPPAPFPEPEPPFIPKRFPVMTAIIIASVALMVLAALGIFFHDSPDPEDSPDSSPAATPTAAPQPFSSSGGEKAKLPTPKPRQGVPFAVYNYQGKVGNMEVEYTLQWFGSNVVTGSYSNARAANKIIYRLNGTRTGANSLELKEYTGNTLTATARLTKSLQNGSVIWTGKMYNTDGKTFDMILKRKLDGAGND